MSIDAVVKRVTYQPDGSALLHLEGRDGKSGPGQTTMVVLNAPPHLDAMVGIEIWGNDRQIMVGDKHWGDRVGYTGIRLVKR